MTTTDEYQVAKLRLVLENRIGQLSSVLDSTATPITYDDVKLIVDVVLRTLDQHRIFPAQGSLLPATRTLLWYPRSWDNGTEEQEPA